MHIALVRRHCSLKKAGAERYCVNLFRGLQKLGHQITVIGEGIDAELLSEVDFVPVAVNHLTSWTKNRSFAENCEKVVRSGKYDLVHGLSRVQGLDTFRLTDPMQTHWIKVWYRHPISRWLQHWNPRHRAILELEQRLYGANGVRRIIVQSKLDERLLKEYFRVDEKRICRIVNGVDTSVFNLVARNQRATVREEMNQFKPRQSIQGDESAGEPISSETPLIVFASMDFRRKGLDSLLTALSRLQNRDIQLLVLGAGDIAGYQKKANLLGIGNRVLFAGRQSSIQRFYAAGDLFVLPTIYEPFPNVNLEAMACGTPVVTTETAGGADIIQPGQNGYLIPNAWSISDLVDRIDQHFHQNSSEQQVMSQNCWRTASLLRVEDNARQVAQVFHDVLLEKNAA